jgi:hypothetical protein
MNSLRRSGGAEPARPAVASLPLSRGRSRRRGLLPGRGGKEIQVVRENGKFGANFCNAEDPAGDEYGGVGREQRIEVNGNGKGVR